MSNYDPSNSGYGYNSDGTPIGVNYKEICRQIKVEVFNIMESLLDDHIYDPTERNPLDEDFTIDDLLEIMNTDYDQEAEESLSDWKEMKKSVIK
jgi:hypothetical protein